MFIYLIVATAMSVTGLGQPTQEASPDPIIDVHFHTRNIDPGAPSRGICIELMKSMPALDPVREWSDQFEEALANPDCDDPYWSPTNDDELRDRLIDKLVKANAIAVLQGPPDKVRAWMKRAPGRFIPSVELDVGNDPPDVSELRQLFADGGFLVLGEVLNQYSGVGPNDPRMEPYWALAEELNIPVGYHSGTGPPGTGLLIPSFRPSMGNPLLFEEVLARHPKLRISIQHMAEGYHEELKLMLWTYPQLYVDISGPVGGGEASFHAKVKDLVDAGFGKRLLFGSDPMWWPEFFDHSLATIQSADYLSEAEKRDILFNNAVRFLQIDKQSARARALGIGN